MIIIVSDYYYLFQSKYMSKEWNPKHKPLLAQAIKDLMDFDIQHPVASDLTLVCLAVHTDYPTHPTLPCTYSRNELTSLAHSFYTCLKHQLMHVLIIVLFRSTPGPRLYANLFITKFYTFEKFMVVHIAAWLNHVDPSLTCARVHP